VLSKTYGVSRQAIDRKAQRLGWERDFADDVAVATRAKVRGVSASATPAERQAAVESLSDARANLIRTHQEAWGHVFSFEVEALRVARGIPSDFTRDCKRYGKNTTDPLTGEDLSGQPILGEDNQPQWYHPVLDAKDRLAMSARLMGLFEKHAMSLQTVQEGQRRAHGFDYKMQMEEEKADADKLRERNAKIDRILAFIQKSKAGHIAPTDEQDNTEDETADEA
jgi:hypothetical protein